MTATVAVGGAGRRPGRAAAALGALQPGRRARRSGWSTGDGRPALRPVAVASYEAREVLVAGGVAEGDEVVTLGVQKLDPGQRVRIVQALQF